MVALALVTAMAEALAMRSSPGSHDAYTASLCLVPTEMEEEYRLMIVDEVSIPDSSDRLSPFMPYIPDTSEVYFVISDTTLCSRAAEALAVYQGRAGASPTPVYLLRVGPAHFIVFNYRKEGEFIEYSIFDGSFTHLDDWLH
jgi:hypothetical protein